MKKYLTVGEVAKMAGVHVKSLHYYDQIGVLRPAYTDPTTKYRYYTYSQLTVLEFVRIFIELGIPLRELSDYVEDNGNKINYEKLLAYGRDLAEKKFLAMRDTIRYIKHMQREIDRNEAHLPQDGITVSEFPKQQYYLELLELTNEADENYRQLWELYDREAKSGYPTSYEFGHMYFFRNKSVSRFLFIRLFTVKEPDSDSILTLPKGEYHVKYVRESKIETAPEEFPALFRGDEDYLVMESEAIIGFYQSSQPVYELRCAPIPSGITTIGAEQQKPRK